MMKEEHGVFWALKGIFATHAVGCYPFNQETFKELIDGGGR